MTSSPAVAKQSSTAAPRGLAPVKLEMNDAFKRAYHLMEETSQSLFITGRAGTGKSTLLDFFCTHTGKSPVILAPTGVAALNVKGQTIHRFFNFYIDVTVDQIRKKKNKPRDPKIYQKLRTIIIDEVSMLRADLLDCIDEFLRIYGPLPGAPFGGVQMVFVGDLYQLPPVVNAMERDIFHTHYKTPYFFSAHVMQDYKLEMVELDHVYRQKDQEFITLLNKIRNNSVEPADIDHLNQRYGVDSNDHHFSITLTTTNQSADNVNDTHLNALAGQVYTRAAEIKGDFGKEYYPTAIDLQFKIGAQVMLLNNDPKKRWVNGSIGVIEGIAVDDEGKEYLKICLADSHRVMSVYPFMWEVFKFQVEDGKITSEPAGSFAQYPFRLAWAVTIHKSQGKTFDRVVIDMGKGSFASGQTYVALSRCTSFEGVHLIKPIRKSDVRTDPRIYRFLTDHAYRRAEEFQPMEQKIALIEQAITDGADLEITYLKANDTKSVRMITPTKIGEEDYKGSRYICLHAYCHTRSEQRVFNAARVIDVRRV